MKRYLITYDVSVVDRSVYPALYMELERMRAVQALESVYLVESSLSAKGVYESLAKHITQEAKLLVVEIATPNNWWFIRQPGATWMKDRGL